MAYGFRFLTRSALTRLTSIWETRHISLLTETVNNVSKIDVYVHQDASLRVSKGKHDCSLTGSQQRQMQTGLTRGYRQCWQPHMSSQAIALPVELEARHLITEHITQCCFIPTESRWWRVGPDRDEGRHFTLCCDHTSQIVAASALITHLWVHKQRPALALLRVSEAEENMQIRSPLNDLRVNQETEGRAGSKWGLFLLFFKVGSAAIVGLMREQSCCLAKSPTVGSVWGRINRTWQDKHSLRPNLWSWQGSCYWIKNRVWCRN